MPPIIFERVGSRSSNVLAEGPEIDLHYMVHGTEDDMAVRALVEATIPANYGGGVKQGYQIQHLGAGIWEVVAKYGQRQPRVPGESTFSFEMSANTTTHITKSLETVDRGGDSHIPDYGGMINVTADGDVEGCDILTPQYNFSEMHIFTDVDITVEYKLTLARVVTRVNAGPFKGFARGEVLFLGASGSKRGADDWEVTFRFAVSPNAAGLSIAGSANTYDKEGWHYAWIESKPASQKVNVLVGGVLVEKTLFVVQRPRWAHVERVYEYGDFSLLNIGVV